MLNACTEEKKIEFYARRVSRNDRAHAKINAFLRFVEFRTQNIAPNCKEHINYKLLFFFFEENNKFRSSKAAWYQMREKNSHVIATKTRFI